MIIVVSFHHEKWNAPVPDGFQTMHGFVQEKLGLFYSNVAVKKLFKRSEEKKRPLRFSLIENIPQRF